MRALWVTNAWPDAWRRWYGVFVQRQAESLRHMGVDVDVVYIPGYRGRHEYLRGIAAMHVALRRGPFDLLHAHSGHSAVIGCLQRRLPLVISYWGSDLFGTQTGDGFGGTTTTSRMLAKGFAQLAKVAAATTTKSQAMAERLPRNCRGRNYVIPDGVDLDEFAPLDADEARRRLGWSRAIPNVLFVGNPSSPIKNFELARAVCAELRNRGRPVELRVAQNTKPADMPVWLSAADALLFTSLSEGSPNAVKEAMAAELPIVSAPVGDVPERLSGVAGTFVVERAPALMADALAAAIDVGRVPEARRAVQELSIQRVAQRILAVYEAVA